MAGKYACTMDGFHLGLRRTIKLGNETFPGDAARRYARELYDDDPSWHSYFEGGARVRVMDEGNGSVSFWVVTVENRPHWSVRQDHESKENE